MRNLVVALLMLAASPALAQDKEKLSATDLTVRTERAAIVGHDLPVLVDDRLTVRVSV